MRTRIMALGLSCGLVAGCGGKPAAKGGTNKEETAAGQNPLLAPVDYLGAQAKGKQLAGKVISQIEIQQAIQKFQAIEDRWPKDLNELVTQHYLQSAPTPPPGFRFAYNPQTGDFGIIRQ